MLHIYYDKNAEKVIPLDTDYTIEYTTWIYLVNKNAQFYDSVLP